MARGSVVKTTKRVQLTQKLRTESTDRIARERETNWLENGSSCSVAAAERGRARAVKQRGRALGGGAVGKGACARKEQGAEVEIFSLPL